MFIEFNPNPFLSILLIPVYFPTVDLPQWQHLENAPPDISMESIRLSAGNLKEYSYYSELFANIALTRNYSKVVMMGDFNTHFVPTSENEQHKYILQKESYLNSFANWNFRRINYSAQNELNYTYFKGDKISNLDYVFSTSNLTDYIEEISIHNDALITTDHNCIKIKLKIALNEQLNIPNINTSYKVKSNELKNEEKLKEYQEKLELIDISNYSMPQLVASIKAPLIRNVGETKNQKLYVDDEVTQQLRRMKRVLLRNKEFRQASEITKRIRKYVKDKRIEQSVKRTCDICQNRKHCMKEWFQLTSRFIKPRRLQVKLMRNEDGYEDVHYTLARFRQFFRDLQYRQIFNPALELMEEWIAQFIVMFFPEGAFERYSDYLHQFMQDNHIIDEDALRSILFDINHSYGTNYYLEHIILYMNNSKNHIKGQFYSENNLVKISIEEVKGFISDTNPNKSPGFDQICNRILKSLPDKYYEKLAETYQDFIDFNYVDDPCKYVIITLLNKTDSELPGLDDFRPISLLFNISFKVLEKLLMKRMILSQNEFQFGFKATNSTVDMMMIFKETVEQCKSMYDNVGTFVASLFDFKKAFNSLNFYKLVVKLQKARLDRQLIATTLNLFMPQKVFFRIGDVLSAEPIRLNVYAGHQGSCSMPDNFKYYIHELLYVIERRQSNLLRIARTQRDYYGNHVTFADDVNMMDYFKNYTQHTDISQRLYNQISEFRNNARELDLITSEPKSKLLTNKVPELTDSIRNWNTWDVINNTKLVGIRFKIKRDLKIDYTEQFNYALNKFKEVLLKLKVAYSINKFLSIKEYSNLSKAFCIPIIDYGNAVTNYKDDQEIKLDQILFKECKHALGFRFTCLTLNFKITLKLLPYSDRRLISQVTFYLKHFCYSFRNQINSCSQILSEWSEDRRSDTIDTALGNLCPLGLEEELIENKSIERFDYSGMSNIEFFSALYLNRKRRVFADTITQCIRSYIKKLCFYRLIVDNLYYDGLYVLNNMYRYLWEKRMELNGYDYMDGKITLKNSTFWFVCKYYDLDSRLNSLEFNTERDLNKRFYKVFLCGYRFGYRIRKCTFIPAGNIQVVSGMCCYCLMHGHGEVYEDELHAIRDCKMHDNLRDSYYNELLILSGFQLTRQSFHYNFDFYLFCSYDYFYRMFELDIPTYIKFNRLMKKLLKQMLDIRREYMVSLSENMMNRPDILEREKYQQFMDYYKWKY